MLKSICFLFILSTANAIQLFIPFYGPTSDAVAKVVNSSITLSVAVVLKLSENGILNDNERKIIEDLTKADVKVLGYSKSLYTSRNKHDVIDDIRKFGTFDSYHKLNGVFLDQASNDIATIDYYKEIYLYVHTQVGCQANLFTNYGSKVAETFFGNGDANRTGDTIVIFENSFNAWKNYIVDPYITTDHADSEVCAIVHSCPRENMEEAVDLAVERNIGFFYVTDRHLNNPYDTLSTYFNDLVVYMGTK